MMIRYSRKKEKEWELEHRGVQERGFRSPLARIGIGLFIGERFLALASTIDVKQRRRFLLL